MCGQEDNGGSELSNLRNKATCAYFFVHAVTRAQLHFLFFSFLGKEGSILFSQQLQHDDRFCFNPKGPVKGLFYICCYHKNETIVHNKQHRVLAV